jgi:aspartate kinase
VHDKSILTLITDVRKSSEVLATVFRTFSREKIPIEMMSQGASKVNVSFVVNSEDLNRANMYCAKVDACRRRRRSARTK